MDLIWFLMVTRERMSALFDSVSHLFHLGLSLGDGAAHIQVKSFFLS